MLTVLVVCEGKKSDLNVVSVLDQETYKLVITTSRSEVEAYIAALNPDLILLDMKSSIVWVVETCLHVREIPSARGTPILVVSDLADESAAVQSLDAGADDFIVNPFSARELVARVNALLRRARLVEADQTISVGTLTIEPESKRMRRAGVEIHLAPTEFALLQALMRRPGRTALRSQLREEVWGSTSEISDRAIDVGIGRLRRALRQQGQRDPIRTMLREGYMLVPDL